MSLTGCSILPQMAAPTANFGLGLYNADSYYSKECLWYEPVQLSAETKEWITKNNLKDLAKIAYYKGVVVKVWAFWFSI